VGSHFLSINGLSETTDITWLVYIHTAKEALSKIVLLFFDSWWVAGKHPAFRSLSTDRMVILYTLTTHNIICKAHDRYWDISLFCLINDFVVGFYSVLVRAEEANDPVVGFVFVILIDCCCQPLACFVQVCLECFSSVEFVDHVWRRRGRTELTKQFS